MNKTFKLTNDQLHILVITYKFRAVSVPLIKEYKKVKYNGAIGKSVRTICDNGYLIKRYNKDYRLLRKAASYYLSYKGISLLRTTNDINKVALNCNYKNDQLSQNAIDHFFSVMSLYNKLTDQYKDKYDILTSQELLGNNNLPRPKPDLYLRNRNHQCLIFNNYDLPLFIIRRTVKQYVDYLDEIGWYPQLIFIVSGHNNRIRLQYFIATIFEETGMDKSTFNISVICDNEAIVL
jgi:hypothetical protein